jgi:hypothetical protein
VSRHVGLRGAPADCVRFLEIYETPEPSGRRSTMGWRKSGRLYPISHPAMTTGRCKPARGPDDNGAGNALDRGDCVRHR